MESIQVLGHNVYYLPKGSWNSIDRVFGEMAAGKFSNAYTIAALIANVEGYESEGDYFSKFGLEIRDTTNFVVSKREFLRQIPGDRSLMHRPHEGDLLYVPLLNKMFEIKFVEEELMFYARGNRNPYVFELRCEMFRFSQENIETGVPEVDDVETQTAYSIQLSLNTGTGLFNIGEKIVSPTASAEVKNWDLFNRVLNVINIAGIFQANSNIVGTTSGASWSISQVDTLGAPVFYELNDNATVESDSQLIIDNSESNPLLKP